MLITRTPFRMSFFGGGTDMADFFRVHGGDVLSTTFDKYCMKKNCAFTICTRSYKGLADTLRGTFLRYHPDYDFYTVFVDGTDNNFDYCIISSLFILRQVLSDDKIVEMQFKYDITELSTSIKPFALNYFFSLGYSFVAYFDPDIAFYSRFTELDDATRNVFITPHIVTLQHKYSGTETEGNIMKHGIYNCGFIAFRNSLTASNVLDWWMDRLKDYSFADAEWGIYTDQKWIDFIPVYVNSSELLIITNLGCNLAPWNYGERKIERKNEEAYVMSRLDGDENDSVCATKLVFMHFSGFDYESLQDGKISHNFRNLPDYEDIRAYIVGYGKLLKGNHAKENMSVAYRYGRFSNGKLILKLHRRLYRAAIEKGFFMDNPFSTDGLFYKILKKNKLVTNAVSDTKSKKTVSNYNVKQKLLDFAFKKALRLLGPVKFTELLLALPKAIRFESQFGRIDTRILPTPPLIATTPYICKQPKKQCFLTINSISKYLLLSCTARRDAA